MVNHDNIHLWRYLNRGADSGGYFANLEVAMTATSGSHDDLHSENITMPVEVGDFGQILDNQLTSGLKERKVGLMELENSPNRSNHRISRTAGDGNETV